MRRLDWAFIGLIVGALLVAAMVNACITIRHMHVLENVGKDDEAVGRAIEKAADELAERRAHGEVRSTAEGDEDR